MPTVSRRQFCWQALAVGAGVLGMPRAVRATPNWIDTRQVGPFVIQAAFPLAGYEALLGELIPLERELRRVLAVRPCTSPLYLHLLANERQHRQYIAERFPQVPYRRALFVKQDGRSSVFAYLNSELAIDVRHECTHALLHGDLPMVPLWLDEGLAEYFEVAQPQRFQHHPNLRAVKRDLLLRPPMSMRELESRRRLEDLSARDYRWSWAWVHFMLHQPQGPHQALVAYLNDIRTNTMPGSLADRLDLALGGEACPPGLAEERLKTHIEQCTRLRAAMR